MKIRHRESLSWTEIIARVDDLDPPTVGIDIFDTILTRKLVGDENAAAVVAKSIVNSKLWTGDYKSLLEARNRLTEEGPDLPSHEAFLRLEEEGLTIQSAAVQIELDVERELIVEVPGAQAALAALRSKRKIIFVSDMHLSSNFLRELLIQHHLFDEADEIVVSCEAGSSKSSGGLFSLAFADQLSRSEGVAFIGNNRWADVTRASEAGLIPVPATAANPTRYESAMAAVAGSPGAVIAAAARQHRLRSGMEATSEVQQLGGQVIGQTMLAFLLWIRARCEELEISSLSFLSRDGELPLRMANAMPADYWSGLQTSYLHCGRRSWSIAALPLIGIDPWIELGTSDRNAFLLHSAQKIPFSSLLERCRISQEDLPAIHHLRSINRHEPLPDGHAIDEWQELLRSHALDKLLLDRAAEPSRLILRSLSQRQIQEATIGLVDVGWRGQQALLVSAIIREATGFEPVHFHFGGHKVEDRIDRQVRIERFALDDSVRPHPIKSPVSCLEMFLASGNARLIGYEEDAEGIISEMFEPSSSMVDTPSQRQLWEGAIAMAGLLPAKVQLTSWTDSSQFLVEETRTILELFWNHPMTREAAALEGLRFERDDAGDSIGRVVRPYALRELLGRATVPRQWQQGSLAVTDVRFRTLMNIYFKLRDRLPNR